MSVTDKQVDFKPSCGNILSAVAPAAIEMGLIRFNIAITDVKIKAINMGALIITSVQTPNGVVYQGDTCIDGVPGTGIPISLNFMDTVRGATGSFLPTGHLVNTFDGIDVTCMNVAMPIAIAKADAFGLTGYESAAELTNNKEFMQRMELVRIQAGAALGLGDVRKSVVPKVGILVY